MLIYYRFNNFCSFNCDSEFSMNAPGGKVKKRFPDNYIETAEGFDLLKSAVIVGENAGGKSNFINSLRYLKSLFVTNTQVKSLRPYVNAVSLNSEEQPIQKFELCFLASNKRIYFYFRIFIVFNQRINSYGTYILQKQRREQGVPGWHIINPDLREFES